MPPGGDNGNLQQHNATSEPEKSQEPLYMSGGNSVGVYRRDQFRAMLATKPDHVIEGWLEDGDIPDWNRNDARAELAKRQADRDAAADEERREREAVERRLRVREIEATESSAESARISAGEAQRNSRIAMAAAFIAMVAAIISLFK